MRILQELYKDGEFSDDSITDVAAVLMKAYEYMILQEPDIEKRATSKFIIAGHSKDRNMGLGIVENSPQGIVSRFVEGTDNPQVVIFQPTDMSYAECHEIVIREYSKMQSAVFSEKVEAALRESVKVVSKTSGYVSEESLFYSISNNIK